MTTNKKFTVIVLDENNKTHRAESISTNDVENNNDENLKTTFDTNYNKFLNSFNEKNYQIKNVKNNIQDILNPLFKKSKYFGYYNPYHSIFIPNSGNTSPYPTEPSDNTGSSVVDTETSLSNLLGAVNRLESNNNLSSPFPDKVTDEEWTNFIISEFNLVDDKKEFEDTLEEVEDNLEEGLSSRLNSNNSLQINILEKKLKREINELKKSIKDLDKIINNTIVKEIQILKKDTQILFNGVSQTLIF